MNHPLFRNKALLIWYFLFWIMLSVVQFFLELRIFEISISISLVDVLISNILFSILGLGVWYVVIGVNTDYRSKLYIITYHGFALLIIVSFWLFVSSQIVFALFDDDLIEGYAGKLLMSKAGLGALFYVLIAVFFYTYFYYERLKEKSVEEDRLKNLVTETQLNALKSQINPHFLFNSLNSVSYLTMTEPAKAQDMVIKLSTFLRYSLKHNENQLVFVSQEIDHIKLYLEIEKVRFGDKLEAVFEVNDCHQCKLPNMLLQPIYENAIKYGVYETTSQVVIHTKIEKSENLMIYSVSNNYDPDIVVKKGEGIGLLNIRKRLGLVYGDSTLLQVKSENQIFTVTLKIPQ
jgi:two-component system, LytTR family, sensor kinase